jgi:imidazolonepropionase
MPLRVHNSSQGTGALQFGIESAAATIDHLEHVTAEEIAALSRCGAIAVFTPPRAFRVALGAYDPGRAMIDAGCPVALGTDFHPSLSPTLSMQTAISLAHSRSGLTAEEAICAATINAAYAVGAGAKVGSLECGKQADVVLLDVPHYQDLARSLGHNLVFTTIKHGTVIYERAGVVRPSGTKPVVEPAT